MGLMGRFLGLWGFYLHRGGFVYIGVVLFLSSGRQNGDMLHRYDAVLQQIAVMKQ